MSVLEAIHTAIAAAQPPPQTEQETCDRIVYPLLRAAGYASSEIGSQRSSAGVPDYTVLPDESAHTFFVEAKAWSILLDEGAARQAVAYAFHNLRRWAVLTNGKEWRLFDAHVLTGEKSDRLLIRASLDEAESMVTFLELIGRESVVSGRIAAFAQTRADEIAAARERAARLALLPRILRSELQNPESSLVTWMCEALREYDGLSGLTPNEVADYYRPAIAADPSLRPAGIRTESPHPERELVTVSLSATQRRFWEEFVHRAGQRGANMRGWQMPWRNNWLIAEWIRRPTNFAYIRKRDCVSIDLYINTGDHAHTATVYRKLEAERAEVEAEFGHPLEWELLKASARIWYRIPIGGLSDRDSSWPAAHDALLDAMVLFRQVLLERIRCLL